LNEDERLEEGLSLLLASKQRWTRMEEVNSPSGVGIEVNEDGREVYSPDAKTEFSLLFRVQRGQGLALKERQTRTERRLTLSWSRSRDEKERPPSAEMEMNEREGRVSLPGVETEVNEDGLLLASK
jgi:hypothetical protein